MAERDRGGLPPIESERVSKRYLVTMYPGIGDLELGLAAIDQIRRNRPGATIDVLCTEVQRGVLREDPRVTGFLDIPKSLLPTRPWHQFLHNTSRESLALEATLEETHYEAVVFGGPPWRFLYDLAKKSDTHIMWPNVPQSVRDIRRGLRSAGGEIPVDVSQNKLVRKMVNAYFESQEPILGETPLYIGGEHLQSGKSLRESIIADSGVPREEAKLLIVNTDTSSPITRPPTELLAKGIEGALDKDQNLVVYMLPSYTDEKATENLFNALNPITGERNADRTEKRKYGNRVQMRDANKSRMSLLDTVGFIDQSGGIFLTGDTGLMHLAAMQKIKPDDTVSPDPRNDTHIIEVFGGTNPAFFGHSDRDTVTIVSSRNRWQERVVPGYFKDPQPTRGRQKYFSGIFPESVTHAILVASRVPISVYEQVIA